MSNNEFYSAIEAAKMNSAELDMRPYLYDKTSKSYMLLDLGASVTAFPPDPGDKPDPKVFLKAINGNRLRSYGTKQVEVQIN